MIQDNTPDCWTKQQQELIRVLREIRQCQELARRSHFSTFSNEDYYSFVDAHEIAARVKRERPDVRHTVLVRKMKKLCVGMPVADVVACSNYVDRGHFGVDK